MCTAICRQVCTCSLQPCLLGPRLIPSFPHASPSSMVATWAVQLLTSACGMQHTSDMHAPTAASRVSNAASHSYQHKRHQHAGCELVTIGTSHHRLYRSAPLQGVQSVLLEHQLGTIRSTSIVRKQSKQPSQFNCQHTGPVMHTPSQHCIQQ